MARLFVMEPEYQKRNVIATGAVRLGRRCGLGEMAAGGRARLAPEYNLNYRLYLREIQKRVRLFCEVSQTTPLFESAFSIYRHQNPIPQVTRSPRESK